MANKNLSAAKKAKQDEFYTQMNDIQAEINAYLDFDENTFRGKTVLLPCDDPEWSNFTLFFAQNFERLGLKKLISTSYAPESKTAKYGALFEYAASQNGETPKNERGKIFVLDHDVNANGRIDFDDLEWEYLKGDGDFRSAECVELLKESDVVVTNPPFSLFREYVAQLIQYGKKFLIIGNLNAMHYKEIFSLFKGNKMWLGASIHSGDRKFNVPETYPLDAAGCGVDENGQRFIRVKGVRWFTNLDYKKRHEEFVYTRKFNPADYPKYVNLDAIDVSESKAIPEDWDGLMGVPDTFLDIYNPDQFDIVGLGAGDLAKEIGVAKNFRGRTDVAMRIDGKDKCPYSRIIIRRKK